MDDPELVQRLTDLTETFRMSIAEYGRDVEQLRDRIRGLTDPADLESAFVQFLEPAEETTP